MLFHIYVDGIKMPLQIHIDYIYPTPLLGQDMTQGQFF